VSGRGTEEMELERRVISGAKKASGKDNTRAWGVPAVDINNRCIRRIPGNTPVDLEPEP
jgi:hypothetical protein